MNSASRPQRQRSSALRGAGLALGALAGTALFNQWSRRRAERDHPPLGQFVTIGGVPVHWMEQGAGSPIVLIHGSGSLMQDFLVSGIVDRLSRQHRVILFDRPGYGHSPRPRGISWTPERQADLIADACSAIGITRPLLLGHSWGVLPALAWALNRPGTIRGLALLSGYYFPSARLDLIPNGVAASPVLGDVLVNTLMPLQARLVGPLGNRMIFSPDPVPDRFVEQMPFPQMLRPGQLHATAVDSAQMVPAAARLSYRYRALDLPITILWGEGDKLVDQSGQSARLAEMLPHAAAAPIADTGHMIHHVHPDRVAAAITALATRA